MRIMVCFDGSEAALAALPVARKLAETGESSVHIVRVVPHNLSSGGVSWSGSHTVDIQKHSRAEAEDSGFRLDLELLAEGFADTVTVAVLNGHRIADELASYARANAIDMIVLGCREYGPMHSGVGGSVTAQLVRARVAPVLLGPQVPGAHLDVRALPLGCAVFSRDGFYLGDYAGVRGGALRVHRKGRAELVLSVADAFELSVASGLHMGFDAVDLEAHIERAPAV